MSNEDIAQYPVALKAHIVQAAPTAEWARSFCDALLAAKAINYQAAFRIISDVPCDCQTILREEFLRRDLPYMNEAIAVATTRLLDDTYDGERELIVAPASRRMALAFLGWDYDRLLDWESAGNSPPLDDVALRLVCAWNRYLICEIKAVSPHDPHNILRVRPDAEDRVQPLDDELEKLTLRKNRREIWTQAPKQLPIVIIVGAIGSVFWFPAVQFLGDWSFLLSSSIPLLGSIFATNNIVNHFTPAEMHGFPRRPAFAISGLYSIVSQIITGFVQHFYYGVDGLAYIVIPACIGVSWIYIYWSLRTRTKLSVRAFITPDLKNDPNNPMAAELLSGNKTVSIFVKASASYFYQPSAVTFLAGSCPGVLATIPAALTRRVAFSPPYIQELSSCSGGTQTVSTSKPETTRRPSGSPRSSRQE